MNSTLFTLDRHATLEQRQIALRQIYQQVLERQPYAHEQKALAKLEKDFLNDKIGVRRFLKELGCSPIYLEAFYFSSSNPKFIERCLKHFLGRAPLNQEEMRLYCDVLMRHGTTALITAILDSEEYRKAFGGFTIPAPQAQRYESPSTFLESHWLQTEHLGQRGEGVPALFWHALGLNCDAGVCRHPEADTALPPTAQGEIHEELLDLVRSLNMEAAKQKVSALSSEERHALRRLLSRR